MTAPPEFIAVGLYAGLNALILLWLTARCGMVRAQVGVSIGDGGDARMIRAMRGQANFVECAPMALLVLLAMALIGTPVWVLHLFGITLTAGRFFHALHFARDDAPGWQRAAGAGLSILMLSIAALGLLGHVLFQMVM